jgi:hypothetical protein|nr:MAG TPA: hypothetical protein [Siphoviridae sp. ctIwT7]
MLIALLILSSLNFLFNAILISFLIWGIVSDSKDKQKVNSQNHNGEKKC